MTARFSYQPGATVRWQGKDCTIREVTSSSSVLVEVMQTKAIEVVPVSKLRPPKGIDPESIPSLDTVEPEDLAEAKRRFAIIKPLVRCERRRDEDVRRIAADHGISRATLYEWIKLYEGRRIMSDLAPKRKGRTMPKRLSAEVEAVITSVINDRYLTKQKPSGEEVILEVHRRCHTARLTKPCKSTIRARLRAIDPKEKLLKREGRKAAHDKYGAVKSEFPGADAPFAVVQIDHTLLDIIVLDEEMHRITNEADKETKRVRRRRAKQQEQRRHRAALTVDPMPAPVPVASTPKPGKGLGGRLALVVDNAGSAPKAPADKSDTFDIDDNEIRSGVEEW